VCGYFSHLAHGDRLNLPVAQGWESANVAVYATNLAGINRGIFPDLVRSGRWGSTLFSLVAIGAAIWLAAGIGGAAAGWLAGLGLGLSPAMLAHGNLMTTDAGVLAFALLGTCLLWRSTQQADRRALFWTTTAFVFGALVKFTGLIWLGAYLLLCIPLVAVQRKDRRVLWQIPVAVGMLLLLLVFLYGPLPQVIRSDTIPRLSGKSIVAGRYIEGLLSQAGHSASGHRAFFHGDRFMQGSWWHTPMSIVLKTPPLWLAAGCIGLVAAVIGARRRWAAWVPWLPVVVFTLLLIMANRMVIGIRHALPLAALGVIAAAVWAARLSRTVVRRAVLVLLAVSAVWTAASPFPHYISYFPAWAGGVGNGHRWLVDSNYDWGQDLEQLEAQWATLVRANGGRLPNLVYFGFVDPRTIYELPCAQPSLLGYMGRMQHQGDRFEPWLADLSQLEGSTVASISALKLNPYGADLSKLDAARELGWVGETFKVIIDRPSPHAGQGGRHDE